MIQGTNASCEDSQMFSVSLKGICLSDQQPIASKVTSIGLLALICTIVWQCLAETLSIRIRPAPSTHCFAKIEGYRKGGGESINGQTSLLAIPISDVIFGCALQADASGSLEAVKGALLAMPQDRVTLRFLLAAAGPITNGDVQLANASQAQVISFNQEPSEAVLAQSKRCGRLLYPILPSPLCC